MAWDIFKKTTDLRPSAMAAVAERRFDDASTLARTNHNARANGVVYLAGFVVEILLKARLVSKHSTIARKRQIELTEADREIWSLIWRRHDLEAMLESMPELEVAVDEKGKRAGLDYSRDLKEICATWTIQARYSSQTIQMDDAVDLLEKVRRLKEVLK